MCAFLYAIPIIPVSVPFAFGGGLAIKLLDFAELAHVRRANWPKFDVWYWVFFLIQPALGAFLALSYEMSGASMQPIVAVNIGITAPLIIRAMANKGESTIPTPPGA
jgi:hypothetical protein